jgi:hypothetical protein
MATMTRDTYDLFKPRERGRFGDDDEIIERDLLRYGVTTDNGRLVGIDVVRHHETDKGLLVSLDGMEANAVWLPKGLCEITFNGVVWGTLRNGRRLRMRQLHVTLPQPIAIEKGLQ